MKKSVNTRTGSRSKRYRKKHIKGRAPSIPTKMPKGTAIGVLVLFIILLILCFINMGTIFTLITALMGIIIYGIAKLLQTAKTNSKKRKVINAILIILLILGIIGFCLFAAFLIYVTIKAPEFDTKLLNTNELTIIYDKDGNVIEKLGSEKREKVKFDQMPQVLVDAIVATEDSRFYQHNGFDAPRFLKASFGQVTGHSDAGGASTLSMQVIKNSFTSTESSGIKGIIRKFTDIYLAVFKLEKKYSKEEILEYYVNNHFLGGNVYGVQEASREYFGKDVTDLNLSEAAIIAGMFKSPNFYRPTANPKNATARRATVLYLMKKHGYINDEEYKLAKSIPVESITAEESTVTSSPYQAYIDTVVDEIEDRYNVNAYVTPLLIYTNMDRSKQDAVNAVLNGETYDWIDEKVQTGVSVLDSGTGKILAIGGGRGKSGANTFNYATQINRQPGSTAKPLFDYGPGIEYNDWSTAKKFDDTPENAHYSDGTAIHNWDNGYYGTITLRRALSASRNIPALLAFKQVDNKKIVNFVENLGITPEIDKNGKIHEAHSIGAFTGVSPLKMSGAYAAFSNGGYYNQPYSVSKIVYRDNGKEEEFKQEKKQVMSDATAFMISSVLQDVSLTGGTPTNVAAKTGTTNYDANTKSRYGLPADAIRDSWVVGYTTKTVIGMWYGYDFIDSSYVLRNLPATIQKDRLFLALANGVFEKNKEEFKMPSSVIKIGDEYYKKGHEPEEKEEKDTKLATPSGLKVSYSGNKVTISWNAVSRLENDENYGEFGYNIYQGNTLLTFTTGTSHTFATTNPYTTYRVIATYKSYSGAQSDAATYTLKEEQKAETSKITCPSTNTKVGATIPTGTACSLLINEAKVNATITIGNSTCGTTTFTAAGDCTVNYIASYNSKKYEGAITYNVTAAEPTPSEPEEPQQQEP